MMKNHLKNFWFLAVLVIVFAAAFLLDLDAAAVDVMKGWIPFIIAVCMFLMSFSLKPEMLVRGALNFKGQTLAFASSYVLIPALCFLAGMLLFPGDKNMLVGLMIAGAVPTTLASASIWTRLSGGNDGFSMVFTIIATVSGVVVTPLVLFIALSSMVAIPVGEMIVKLVMVLILPVLAGQVVRVFTRAFSDKAKPVISIVCQFLVLAAIFIAVSHGNCSLTGAPVFIFIKLAVFAAAVHVAAFFACYGGGRAFGITRPDYIALSFSGSQKTLQLGILIATMPCFAEYCFVAFPMIFYHAVQLAIDVVFIELYKRKRL
jgi:sodium/bile acid cotransporter 7